MLGGGSPFVDQEKEHEATHLKINCCNGPKSNYSTHLVEPFVCVTIWLKLPNTFP